MSKRFFVAILPLVFALAACAVGAEPQDNPPENLVRIPAAPDFRFASALGAKPAPGRMSARQEKSGEKSPIEKDYWLAKYPVVNEEYYTFLQENPGERAPSYWKNGKYPKGKERHPVLDVSYDDALRYCEWLNDKHPGWKFRLPTEAEWEYAAVGKTGFRYPWGNESELKYSNGRVETKFSCNAVAAASFLAQDDEPDAEFVNPKSSRFGEKAPVSEIISISPRGQVQGWIDHGDYAGFVYTDLFRALSEEGGMTTPVDEYPDGKSAFGLFDMSGNSWDWTSSVITATNGAERGKEANAIRGGSWYATAASCSATFRGEGRRPQGHYNTVGFRVAADRVSDEDAEEK